MNHSVLNPSENIHAETYALLLQSLIQDERQRRDILNSSSSTPSIADKNEWARRWIQRQTSSFGERLVAFACVEGIFFQSSFAIIYWFKQKGKMPGLSHSNDLISRDEALHTEFACLMLSHLEEAPPSEIVATTIVREAVSIEVRFIQGESIRMKLHTSADALLSSTLPEALSQPIPGLNAESMIKYVEFVGDQLLQSMGYRSFFKTNNPVRVNTAYETYPSLIKHLSSPS